GDHFQLPPTVKSVEAAKEFNITLMEKLVALYPQSVVLLEEQYRMHETIMGFSSREFYSNRLKAHSSVAHHLVFQGDKPFLFIDTAGCGFEELREGNKISNPEEANFLLKQLDRYVQELEQHGISSFPSTGIISPYRHQVELLKESLQNFPALQAQANAITINTIDSFQGQERDMIYISLARSNADAVIGFLSEIRRTNVAMTRARKKLVITGDSATLSQFPFYADLINYAETNDAYISAWELMY
ncbi:MAG: ATP-binding protein, partial [Flavisolibacter sp.]